MWDVTDLNDKSSNRIVTVTYKYVMMHRFQMYVCVGVGVGCN